MASDLRAGSVAKLVFRRSLGTGDSELLCGDVGGIEGERSESKRALHLKEELAEEEDEDEEDDKGEHEE